MILSKLNKYWLLTGCLTGVAFFVLLIYFFFMRGLIPETFHGDGPLWFEKIINTFYPRFVSEKNRFPVDFFVAKADWVVIRCSALLLLSALISLFCIRFSGFRNRFNNFWVINTSADTVNTLKILYFLLLILFLRDLFPSIQSLSDASSLYRPHLIFRLFGTKMPSEVTLQVFWWLSITGAALAVLNIKPVISAGCSVLFFIILQGYVYSFGKTDHTYAVFTYAGMLVPFLLLEKRKALNDHKPVINSRALKLIMISIALSYLFAGLEKLTISGMQWFDPDTLRAHLFFRQTELGMVIAESDFLCVLLQTLTLTFQLGFFLVLFIPESRLIILSVGVLFHLGTFLIFGIGWYISPWVYAYIFFVDWGKIGLNFLPLRPKKKLSGK